MRADVTLQIGIEGAVDPSWPAGAIYLRNVIHALGALPSDEQAIVRVLPINVASGESMAELARRYSFVELALPPGGSSERIDRLLLARRIKRVLQPIFGRVLDPAFASLDVTYPGWGTPIPGVPQIQWIPDFQHVHLPELFSPKELKTRTRAHAEIASKRGTLVLSSESALRDFEATHPNSRVSPKVWPFCSTFTEKELGDSGQTPIDLPPFFFYVANQFWAHKEHLTLFRAMRLLRKQGVAPVIVCTGLLDDRRDPEYARKLTDFIKGNDLGQQLILLGLVERHAQIQIFRRCAAVIQPSRFEGWSTVVEDAKALGRPVILSDIDVHKEQLPNGHFFRVGSPASLATAIGGAIDSLRPGPDPGAEESAQRELADRRVKLGRLFLEICHEATNLGERE